MRTAATRVAPSPMMPTALTRRGRARTPRARPAKTPATTTKTIRLIRAPPGGRRPGGRRPGGRRPAGGRGAQLEPGAPVGAGGDGQDRDGPAEGRDEAGRHQLLDRVRGAAQARP